uniref:Radical SAM core domain-containing protein n=1 Tax=Chromera velia CCMP2878 TaxID=1169474 RepID=A0A0G4HD77_9ALVE|mmetsp:Transcript_1340/g.2789  ORF Transcript_1340/g.2789 Transcript_1340/m.2789 type:complete len:471 (+) Transcript_1340:58-1470(+)|eukprot:Cvel_26455.t1-p1 / transcript=Cvel_26455.t1 / gene=Cvel_26455 / organism=Chromera_velia_CCMP2878 / gene_product=Ribosomal RNA large subunit methyltransferase Cfr, putative / transcript_product=Ribosomal RNA large subunit methyltransferase Cfr, putative / location=Cvel_scaffold3146:8057-13995(-) / protein_length=470 / sequence_SO=supercontig / SO=protein_coding / is_pseudo=false
MWSRSGRCRKVRDVFTKGGFPDWRLDQFLDYMYKKKTDSFLQMNKFPKKLRQALVEELGPETSTLKAVGEKRGGQAQKVLFETRDGHRIEAVSLDFKSHKSLCISSQAGCAFNCSFCATGKVGLKRQLSVDEITDQVLYFQQQRQKIDSISFMGMGEPLANPYVFDALSILSDRSLFGMSPRRLNISTIGIFPGIKKLTELHPQVNLAYSLHSPFPEERNILVPANRLFPLEEAMELLDERIAKTGRQVWLAYILLKDRTDSREHTEALVNLLKQRREATRHLFHVNLLPYNAARGVEENFVKVEDNKVLQFKRILDENRISSSYRNSFGSEIDAACGQLFAEYEKTKTGELFGMRRSSQTMTLPRSPEVDMAPSSAPSVSVSGDAPTPLTGSTAEGGLDCKPHVEGNSVEETGREPRKSHVNREDERPAPPLHSTATAPRQSPDQRMGQAARLVQIAGNRRRKELAAVI